MIQGSGEEYNSHGEHVVEIPTPAARRMPPRRSFGTLAVALGLTLVGAGIVGVIAHDHSVRARTEAAQREELKDGWSTLAALATQGAQRDPNGQPNAAQVQPAAPSNGTPSTVVVVNVPMQGAVAPAAPAQSAAGASSGAASSPPLYANPGAGVASPAPYPGAANQVPYQSASNQGSPSQGVPLQYQGAPLVDYSSAAGVPNGTVPGASANPGLVGSVPAANPVPNIPNGTVSVPSSQSLPNGSNINQSVSNGTIPGAPVPGAAPNGATGVPSAPAGR